MMPRPALKGALAVSKPPWVFTRMIAQPTVLSPFSGKRDFAGRDKSAKTAP